MNARAITEALGGHWLPGGYGMAPCPCHNDGKAPALKLSDDAGKSDGVDLVCFAGCAWQTIKAELRRRGMLPDRDNHAPARDPAIAPPDRTKERAAEAAKMAKLVSTIWRDSQPAPGSIVERYLLERRKLTGGIPPSLRYHRALRHGPTGLDLPAMVAAVQGPDRKICGLHRTFLRADGADKAAISQNRLMLGPCAGGAVRLAAAGPTLAIGEGIETCLAAMQLTGLPSWAALSTSGLRTIAIPPEVAEIVILQDNDGPGREASEAAADRLRSGGQRVRILSPAAIFKDWNDQLIGSAVAA